MPEGGDVGPMSDRQQFDDARRRTIYEYVERTGAVEPEAARTDISVEPDTDSKPARSGAKLSVSMSPEEFDHHVSILQRNGHIEEKGGKLRVAVPLAEDTDTVAFDDLTATVRRARQEDISEIVGVVETVAEEERYVVAQRLAERVTRDDVLLRYNESEDRVFFVATVDDDTIGWLHVGGAKEPQMEHTARLTLGILEQYRGNGLGSTLMDRGLEWADSQGYRKIYQSVPASNEPAIDFLEAEGWRVESTRDGHYCIDGDLVDETQLAIWLDE